MPKPVVNKKNFSFVGGLNTEAGPLTYPANTWSEGDNVVPDIDGSLGKRTSLNFEVNNTLGSLSDSGTAVANGAYVVDEWNSVGGDGSLNFIVAQHNNIVSFYDNSGSTVSPTEKGFYIDLNSYKAPGNPNAPGTSPISVASANGKLVIVSADTVPILVTYSSGSISVAAIDIRIRDLYGVDDNLAVEERPTTLSSEHYYNLLNQGWTQAKALLYQGTVGYFPSNAQSWTAGKDTSDDFSPTLLDKQDFGTSPAPKGRFTLELFNRDRGAASGTGSGSVAIETELYRPTCSAFYAGRAWYAGVQSALIGSWVVFSQVADTDERYGKCYQDADPTSELISDLIDSDGGVIPIQDAGNIVKLVPAYNSMLVFADNGIWQIVGGFQTGFSATAYEVRKVSNVGCIGPRTVCEAEQVIYFWATDGIWVIKPTDSGNFTVENVTNTTVQREFAAIPVTGMAYASGRYFTEHKTIYWVYNSDESQDGVTTRYKKDRFLCLDLRLSAFFTHTVASIEEATPYITDLVVTRNRGSTISNYTVIDSDGDTVVAGSDIVVVNLTSQVPRRSDLRFWTLVPFEGSDYMGTTFSWFEDGNNLDAKFKDWFTHDDVGAAYDAYIITGYDLGTAKDQPVAGGEKEMQAVYITVFCTRTETGIAEDGSVINPSSCLMQGRWDFTDSAIANKWTTTQQVYRHRRVFVVSVPSATFDDGYPVVVTKSKLRGRGKALQIRFLAEDGKDMQLQGWAITYTGNANV